MSEGYLPGAELAVRGVRKRFGPVAALGGIDLTIQPGELLAVLGPSGCGKSTLLKVIAGLIRADAGEVWLGGKRLDGVPPSERGVGFVFQNYALFPHLTVADNVAFGLKMRGAGRAERAGRVRELLELVGLTAYARQFPRQLSGGEQQRVALARALAPRPSVLLLDEPLSALDVQIRRYLRKEIAALQKDLGLTMVFVTHDQEEAFELGDRIGVMRAGRLVQVGTPQELYESPVSEFVARFIGQVNVLHGEGDGAVVRVGRWPLSLPQRGETGLPVTPASPGGTRRLMIRPEEVELLGPPAILASLAETGANVPQNLLGCRVVTTLYLGTYVQVTLAAEDGQLFTADVRKDQVELLGVRPGLELIAHFRKVQELLPDDAGSGLAGLLPGKCEQIPAGSQAEREPGGRPGAGGYDGGAGI
ncbi:MAG: ABC transporter ATP-binding protein [Betaproteobacteria bacterium]